MRSVNSTGAPASSRSAGERPPARSACSLGPTCAMISWKNRYREGKLHVLREPEPDGEKAAQVDLVAGLQHVDVHGLSQAIRAARRAQILENRPSPLPEDAGVARRDERQVQTEIDALPTAEHELALVDLDLRLAVDGEKEPLPRRALADLARRVGMQRHSRRRRGGVSGKRPLDHHPRFEAGPVGEATDEVPILLGELHARRLLRRRGSGLGSPPHGLARLRHSRSLPRRPRVQPPRAKSRLPSCRSPNTTTRRSKPSRSNRPTTWTTDSKRAFTLRRVTSSTPRKTSRPPSSAGTGRKLNSARPTEMLARMLAKSAVPRRTSALAWRTMAIGPAREALPLPRTASQSAPMVAALSAQTSCSARGMASETGRRTITRSSFTEMVPFRGRTVKASGEP